MNNKMELQAAMCIVHKDPVGFRSDQDFQVFQGDDFFSKSPTHRIHGTGIYLPTFAIFYH